MAKSGLLPAVFLPDGEIRFDRAELEKFLADHKKPNATIGGKGGDGNE